jgi:peptidoglycan hydrolase-like protein with peptidoglycan-binding domain
LKIRMRVMATVLVACSIGPAHALDWDALLIMQQTLREHGFDPGEPDGEMGGKTRAAMSAFAEKYGAPDDPDELFLFMVRRSYETFSPITDEETLERIRVGVGAALKDPESARIRNVKRVTAADNSTFICGEVNGKNSYGAYAGFVPFRSFGDEAGIGSFTITTYETLPYMIEENDENFVFYMCELAFPRD